MVKDIRICLFVALFFLLGSIHVLYNVTYYIILLSALFINIKIDYKGFVEEVRKEWKYLMLPIVVCVYLVVHYLFSLVGEPIGSKVSWKTTESLLLYFFVITLYLLSAKRFMTPHILWKALKAFCWGVLVFNLVKFFCVTGLSIFLEPSKALAFVYQSRFGCNMDMLGGFIYLEPQATYLCITALISYFTILKYDKTVSNRKELLSGVIIFVFSLIFLSFTVTKGAILSFVVGMLFLSIVYWTIKSLRFKLYFLGFGLLMLIVGYDLLSKVYIGRFREMRHEIEHVREGDYYGFTVSSRLGVLKESMIHWNDYTFWGLGVYKDDITDEWYANSPYVAVESHNSHNTFFEYWLDAGIVGVLFILSYFIGPLIRMIRSKRCLYLVIATVTSLFITGNIYILMSEDSRPMFIFILAIFYLYQDCLWKIQNNKC